jgi:hypothetical protein
MADLLSRFDAGELIGLVAVAGGMLIALTAIIGGFWHQNRLISLKHEMVSRGMSPDEIQAVLNAGSDHHHRRHSCRA